MNQTNPVIDTTNGIITFKRSQPPSHFIWKIKNFSNLVDSEWEKIESGHFEVDGHKWKLTFYPNGDDQVKDSYNSLYLSVLGTTNLPLTLDLTVKFQIFVFDQIHDNYLVIQDVKDVCRFHRMKSEWGFAKFFALDDFNEPSNGFLLDDCCIFGVDIFVIKAATRGETLSVVKPFIEDNSYTFTIEKFSTIEKDHVESDAFTIQGMKWKLKLFLKGDLREKENVSLYLLLDSKLPDYNSKVYVKCKVRLIDQVHSKNLEKTFDYGFYDKQGYGYPSFAPLSDVKNPSKGFLVNDTIIVKLEIDYLSTVNHFS